MPDHVFSQKVTDSQHINLKPAAPTPHEFAAVDHEWLSAGSLVPPAPSAASSSTQNESVMELLQSAPEPSAVALMKPLPQLSAVALADTPHVLSVVALMQPLARQAPGYGITTRQSASHRQLHQQKVQGTHYHYLIRMVDIHSLISTDERFSLV